MAHYYYDDSHSSTSRSNQPYCPLIRQTIIWFLLFQSFNDYYYNGQVFGIKTTEALELRANCGFPGKPYRSKIIPEEKLVYEEGETVSYQCQDYWAPPQMRKCVNGVWVGPPARCGDFVLNVLLHDAKLLDMSFGLPIEQFHYQNINLSTTDWKYPNAFTSNRYKEHRLKVTNDHEYMWKFNFTRPAVKLFVKVNFNFINFTLLDQAIRNNFSFYIDVEISPYRTCNLDYQSNNAWNDNGMRIDSYFTCEAHTYEDLQRDIDQPSNYMYMRTKSSHNLPHELVALFFGHVYGNETEPLCGEPETDFGQSSRANQENRDYIIDCLNGMWKDATPNHFKHYVYTQRCIADMIWNGTRPRCIPIRYCPIEKILQNQNDDNLPQDTNNNNNNKKWNGDIGQDGPGRGGGGGGGGDYSNEQDHQQQQQQDEKNNPLIVDAILRYYNFIDNQTIYAIDGTEIVYKCASLNYILVPKDTRICKRDMTWSGVEPVCKYIKPTTNDSTGSNGHSSNNLVIIIICMGTLLAIIILASCILFLICTKRLNITTGHHGSHGQHHHGGQSNKNKNTNDFGNNGSGNDLSEWQNSENYYDNIEMNFGGGQNPFAFGGMSSGSGGGGGPSGTGGNVGSGKNDVFYDIYETVDSQKDGHHGHGHHHHHHHGGSHKSSNDLVSSGGGSGHFYGEQTHLTSNKENDYIRMFGAISKTDSHIQFNQFNHLVNHHFVNQQSNENINQNTNNPNNNNQNNNQNNGSLLHSSLIKEIKENISGAVSQQQQQQQQQQQSNQTSSSNNITSSNNSNGLINNQNVTSNTKTSMVKASKMREPSYLEVRQ